MTTEHYSTTNPEARKAHESLTTDRPILISQRHATDRLIADAAHRIQLAASCPPIDQLDLYILFATDSEAAYAQIARLSPNQFVAQAIAMAGYVSEILGVNWSTEDIIARWRSAIERRGLRVKAVA